MNGIHDIGGRHGPGPVIPEVNEPPFHAAWEGRMHGIAVACQVSGINNSPEHRSAVEQLPYATYLHNSYYENWVFAFEALLVRKGVVTSAELRRRASELSPVAMQDHPHEPTNLSEYASKLKAVLYRGAPQDRPISRRPKFQPGDPVRTLNLNSCRHSRLPGYVRDKTGVVAHYHGAHCHAEAQAEGHGELPEHLYAVRFTAYSLWGPDAEAGAPTVCVDLFEDYLQAV